MFHNEPSPPRIRVNTALGIEGLFLLAIRDRKGSLNAFVRHPKYGCGNHIDFMRLNVPFPKAPFDA